MTGGAGREEKIFKKNNSERQPRSRWGSFRGWGCIEKLRRKSGQNNGLLCRYRQTHTNGEKTRETAKKAAKNAILFVSLKRCKEKRKQAKKRNETKQNAKKIVIR